MQCNNIVNNKFNFFKIYKKYNKVFCSGRVFFALVHRCSKRVCGGLCVCKKIYVYI